MAELLAGTTDRRRVDDRHELLDVLDEQPIEERFVAVLERREPDVLLEVVFALATQMLEFEGHLLVDRENPRRQEPAQTEPVALVVVEGEILVQNRIREDVNAAGLLAPLAIETHELSLPVVPRSPSPVRSSCRYALSQVREKSQPDGARL